MTNPVSAHSYNPGGILSLDLNGDSLAATAGADHPMTNPSPTQLSMQGGILSLDLHGDSLVATAGADHTVQLFDRQSERVLASLSGHSKRVTGDSAYLI